MIFTTIPIDPPCKDCNAWFTMVPINLHLTLLMWKRKYAWLLTQIRNIRKMILPTQMPMTIFKTCESISAHMSPSLLRSPFNPLRIPAPQSDWNTWDDHNSLSGSNPGSFMVMIQIPSYQQTMFTSSSIIFQEFPNYQANIETKSLIFENHKTAISPSLSKAWGEQKPVVPVPVDLHHKHEVL